MKPDSARYREHARETLTDTPGVREAVTAATLAFDQHRANAYAEVDSEAWRDWAQAVKDHALTHLGALLREAEARLEGSGVQVHWAETAEDVHATLRALVERRAARRVVKGKSMLSEELGVNEALEGAGVEVFETDLGEYIIQLLGEPPSHIVGPAIHRSLADVRALFHQRMGTAPDAAPDTLAAAARSVLRQAFLQADIGITGCNFLVAETGTLAVMENEGNIRLSTSVPPVHVALVGIEKVIPRWSDLAGFLQLTARAATGQPVGTFVSMVQGPRGVERDGPEEVHVILVDNGRTQVLADEEMWKALRCVRCGACLNACPVFRQTGGHAYGWVYSGPIGAVLAPAMLGLEAAHPLPYASSLCGACADVCPVRIPIPEMLVEWRSRSVAAGLQPAAEGAAMAVYSQLARRPAFFRAAQRALRALPVLAAPSGWKIGRAWPRPSRRSFRELWDGGEV